MTQAQIHRPTETKKTFRARLLDDLTPEGVRIYTNYRKTLANGADITEAREEARKRVRTYVGSVFAAAGVYRLTATFYGVGAWDTGLQFSAQETWMKDASPLAVSVVTTVSSAMTPNTKSILAQIVIPIEIALSLVRIYVEQRIWRKMKITPNPQGTLLTPYVDGVIEMGYKAIVKYPENDEQRLNVGLIGIYGNLIRLANDALLYFIGKKLNLDKESVRD